MLTSDELRNFDLFVAAIKKQIDRFPKKFQYCALKAITEGPRTVFCIIRSGVNKQGKTEVLEYGKLQLHSEVFPQTN